MESIEVTLSAFTLRSGSLAVAHREAGLTRGLEDGEHVVLHDAGGEWHAASVADIDFTLDDTIYRLEIGARLSDEAARARLSTDGADTAGRPVTTQDLLGLLGGLRTSSAALSAGIAASTAARPLSAVR